jgi:hypothetical protein
VLVQKLYGVVRPLSLMTHVTKKRCVRLISHPRRAGGRGEVVHFAARAELRRPLLRRQVALRLNHRLETRPSARARTRAIRMHPTRNLRTLVLRRSGGLK